MIEIDNEISLLSVVRALIPPNASLSHHEARRLRNISPYTNDVRLADIRAAIRAGADPLGAALLALTTQQSRRQRGATYTPRPIVEGIVSWAAKQGYPARVVDPGAGSGRFLIEAARRFPRANLVAIEQDPLAALVLRANLEVHRLSARANVIASDYRIIELPESRGRTLFVGNPPYTRHHHIAKQWKEWYRDTAARQGIKASTLAGLHIHFFFKTRELARDGDYGAFITSAEWLDVNYGSAVRNLLADGLGGQELHVLDPKLQPFPDVQTTGAIACFHVGRRSKSLRMRSVNTVSQIGDLGGGTPVPWDVVSQYSRWSSLVRGTAKPPLGQIELGEICRVHRGQVTGNNRVWIADERANSLPKSVLVPTVTKARDIIGVGESLANAGALKAVIDLPADLKALSERDRESVEEFLHRAKSEGAADSYTARHRRSWWAVGLRAPAPILCTYMGRRPPVFVRNLCEARHINIAHGLYPRDPLSEDVIIALTRWLRGNVDIADGRTYAGGLTKFEPRELERLHIPRPENLP